MSSLITKLLSTTGGVAAETDEFFNQTTLLLHGDGTNGAQNNTFLDSSANSFTITRNGNTTQGSYSPYGDRWSNYFDAASLDRLNIADSPQIEFGSSDFTIEAWIYPTATDTPKSIATRWTFGDSSKQTFQFNLRANDISFSFQNTQGFFQTTSSPVTLNQWNHVAITKSGTVGKIWVNGVEEASSSSLPLTVTDNNGGAFTIGGYEGNSNTALNFEGYISDFRYVKGSVIYTSAFTPPTESLTAVTGTVLLTCQSNRFIDNSSNGFAITVNGDTKVTPFSPYAPSAAYDPANEGGSGYFDGTGDYLTGPTDSAFDPSSSDFTVEAWVYSESTDTSNGKLIVNNRPTGNSNGFYFVKKQNNTIEIAGWNNISLVLSVVSTGTITNNAWHHVAVVKSGTTWQIFIDGVADTSGTQSNVLGAGGPLQIGRDITSTNRDWEGYISDVRIVKGTALYTANFTPPTAPLPVVTNTSLLCNFDNAGIFDSTGKNVIETVGNAQIDTTTVKYGTGAMEFDGTGDYLTIPDSEIMQLGSNDFTIECWVNRGANLSSFHCPVFVNGDPNGSSYSGVRLDISNDGKIQLLAAETSSAWKIAEVTSAGFNTQYTWQHIAIVRTGATITLYADGQSVLSGSLTSADAALYNGTLNWIGNLYRTSGTFYFNGYLDDLRITKGVARYTANFTPPTKAFPDQ